jgi:ATP-dependent exoDNAse (exonuclease V) beta subunit
VEGDVLRYGEDAGFTGVVVPEDADRGDVEVAAVRPPTLAELPPDAPVPPELMRRVAPLSHVAPLFRRSATEVMVLARNPDEHYRAYVSGLRDVRFARDESPHAAPRDGHAAGAAELDARTTGDVVHAMMEMDAAALDHDLDRVLERELSLRLGAEGASALSEGARARLRRLVDDTRRHVAVARLTDGEAVERELPFTWFVRSADGDGAPGVFQGAMDLVARVDGALEVLDFKTHRIAAGQEDETAAAYEIQRDLYSLALAELHKAPAAFSFFFPETGGEVRTALTAGELAAARERLAAQLRAVPGRPPTGADE